MGFVSIRAAAVVTVALALGCGSSDPVENLAQVNAAVKQAQAVVDRAKEALTAREGEVAEAQERFEHARAELGAAETELAQRKSEIDREATDTLLFRAVQKRLLEDADLDHLAISAGVSGGVVTLSGSVDDAGQRDRAVAVTREIPGVERVESRLQVKRPQPEDEG